MLLRLVIPDEMREAALKMAWWGGYHEGIQTGVIASVVVVVAVVWIAGRGSK